MNKNNKKFNGIHIQGDIGLFPCEAPEIAEVIKHNGEYTLAYGEASNHAHVLRVKEPEQMAIVKDKDGNVYIQLLSKGTLSHEIIGSHQKADHGVHIITPKWYRFGQERLYDYWLLAPRKVID